MATQEEAAESQAAGVWATFRDTPVAAKAILGGVLLSRLGGFLNIFIVLYMVHKKYSNEEAAASLSLYGVGSVIGIFIGATISHRMGVRNATILAMGGTAVFTVSLLYLPNYGLLLAAILLVSIAAQINRPSAATLLSDVTPENRQVMIFAIYRFGLNAGTAIAPLLGFALYYADNKNYTLLFWGEGLVALIYALIATFTIPPKDKPAPAEEGAPPAPEASYRVMFQDRRYLLYLVAALTNSIIYVQYLSALPLDIAAHHVQIFWYTLAVSLNAGIVIAFELPVTKIVQKLPLRLLVGLAYLMVGIGVGVYALPLGAVVIIGGTLIWTLGEIVGAPSVFSYPAIAGPPHLKSRYIGSFQFMFVLGTAVGPLLSGVLFVALGHHVWLALAPVAILTAYVGMAGVRSPEEREAWNKSVEAEAAETVAEPDVSGAQPT
jgi:MFS family permease